MKILLIAEIRPTRYHKRPSEERSVSRTRVLNRSDRRADLGEMIC